MQTRVIIEHDTAESLKASPLWAAIMAAVFADEGASVSVIDVGRHFDETEVDAE